MVTMQPRPEFIQYRANVPQWRVWNVTTGDFPPFALVVLGRDQGPLGPETGFQNVIHMARTAAALHGAQERHARDATIDNQITYEAFSGPTVNWQVGSDFERGPSSPTGDGHLGVNYDPGFYYAQAPESYLALFERGLKADRMGLATQHWPVLTRFVGDIADIADAWPRYAVADLDNFGVKLHEDGPFQIMSVHPNPLPDSELVWIAPRHIAYRDAWAVGEIAEAVGTGSSQELKGATVAVNSPGGDDILTIDDGRIVAHKLGIYRLTLTAIISGDPPDHDGDGRLTWITSANQGRATGSFGWLPQGTETASGHTHPITIGGGAGGTRLWDRTTSTVTYTHHIPNLNSADIPREMRLIWTATSSDVATRIRYFVEYLRPARWIRETDE